MDPLFLWIEQTQFSVWVRESPSLLAFPGILVLHTLGMAFLVGTSAAVNLRTLGFAPGVSLAQMTRFFPLMWLGFGMSSVSGIALLMAYPTKALTNPLFYVKLVAIALAVTSVGILAREMNLEERATVFPSASIRFVAAASLLLWAGAITTGRLLAYTYVRLTAG